MSEKLNEAKGNLDGLLNQFEEAGIPKPESLGHLHDRASRYAGTYPRTNLAVTICDRLFTDATKEATDEGKSAEDVMRAGKIAYCLALPKLSGAINIRDFIACVAYAMSLDIIPGPEAARLIYAAKVAHTALKKKPLKRGQSPVPNPPPSEPTQDKSIT
jgi:hypothetical protein